MREQTQIQTILNRGSDKGRTCSYCLLKILVDNPVLDSRQGLIDKVFRTFQKTVAVKVHQHKSVSVIFSKKLFNLYHSKYTSTIILKIKNKSKLRTFISLKTCILATQGKISHNISLNLQTL